MVHKQSLHIEDLLTQWDTEQAKENFAPLTFDLWPLTFVVHLAVVCTSAADGEQSCTSATCLFNKRLSGEGMNEDRWAVLVTSESGS